MKWAGVVLTTAGSGSLIGSAIALARLEPDTLTVAAVPGLLGFFGVAMLGVGIPLWAVGASDRPSYEPDDDADWSYAPEVRLGAGRVDLTWVF